MLQFSVVKKLRNRLHVKVTGHHFTEAEAAYVEDTLLLNDAIVDVTFYTRSSQIAIKHTGDVDAVRDAVLGLRDLDLSEAPALNEYSPRLVNKKYREMMINRTALYLGKKAVLPAPIAAAWAWFDGIKFIGKAIKTLWQRKLTVEVLDGVAIGAALLQKDYPTAGAVMYLLGIGDILEEWTHRKSVLNLAQSMSLNVDKVWVLVDDIEVSKPVNEVVAGDQIIIRQGEVIPLDGVVIDGVVLVNESSMTGEPEAVRRDQDSSVYEQMKSGMEQQAYRMADKLVPISFIGAGLTYLLTRNVMKALSFVMVDFSCALKLSIPLAVLSAMQEASKRGITVKGGKFLEQIAQADMIVFDKTGTLTKAEPEFEQIIPFNGHDADEMLKLAACIEEHFPHSMAKAIVRAAKDHDLPHKEMHSDVEYVVAHGIASKVGRYRVRIGSAHYIFDDEKTKIPADEQEKFNNLPNSSSHIYLAIGGTLAAVICIKDPVREEAKQVIADLHTLGIKKVVMMTGDSKRNAQRVADELGIDELHAEVLPEDKAAYVKQAKAEGYTVMMVGDGINDSPAISEAHVGIAMNEGAPIAQKIANVTISSDHLQALVDLRRISMALMKRIKANYNGIVGFNGALVGGGVLGIMPPSQTAWLHNLFTLGIGLESMTPLLKKEEPKDAVPTIDVTADSVVA
ncbi:MAG: heavy metal translocating P-type ATPase [Veillonella sp.]|nr:heavy metal translocating P-type ATPase [Veillonella sp.]